MLIGDSARGRRGGCSPVDETILFYIKCKGYLEAMQCKVRAAEAITFIVNSLCRNHMRRGTTILQGNPNIFVDIVGLHSEPLPFEGKAKKYPSERESEIGRNIFFKKPLTKYVI